MENQEGKETHPSVTIHCEIVEDADAGIDSDATVKLATSTHQPSPLAPTTQRGDFFKQSDKKSEKCHPYTRSQERDNETEFNMEERWRVHDNIIKKLRKQQSGKSPEQITAELKCHQLHMKDLQRRITKRLPARLWIHKSIFPTNKSTIAEVKRCSEIKSEIEEEINRLCDEINRLQQQ